MLNFKHPLLYQAVGLLCIVAQVAAQTPSIWVDSTGAGGAYKKINDALAAAKSGSVIGIRTGSYKEKVIVTKDKSDITMIGVGNVVIYYDDRADKPVGGGRAAQSLGPVDPWSFYGPSDVCHKDQCAVSSGARAGGARAATLGTSGSSSFIVLANGFTGINLNIQNTFREYKVQAVALRVEADRAQFYGCRIIGWQDTLYLQLAGGRCYFEKCYVEGNTDFIFGASTALFRNCDLHFVKNQGSGSGGTLTAQSCSSKDCNNGFVFDGCRITGENKGNFLGRPWRPYSTVIVANSYIDASIDIKGWDDWDDADNRKTATYAEYKNSGPGCVGPGCAFGNKRPEGWTFVFSDAQVARYLDAEKWLQLSSWKKAPSGFTNTVGPPARKPVRCNRLKFSARTRARCRRCCAGHPRSQPQLRLACYRQCRRKGPR